MTNNKQFGRSDENQNGSALMASMGLLVALGIIGVIFIGVVRSESRSSSQNNLEVRADMLARSGVEHTMTQLKNKFSKSNPSNLSFIYGRTVRGKSTMTQTDVPLGNAYWVTNMKVNEAATKDSNGNYSIKIINNGRNYTGSDGEDNDGDGKVDELDEGGDKFKWRFGYSHRLPATLKNGRDLFAIKVVPTQGLIHVNGPDIAPHNDRVDPLSKSKKKMLNNLARILNKDNRENPHWEQIPASGGSASIGDMISRARMKIGRDFQSIKELKSVFERHDLNETYIKELKPYITAHAWVDKTTLDPRTLTNLPSNDEDPTQGNPRFRRTEKGKDMIQPRAPIDVNHAPKEVLAALFAGIEASYLYRFKNMVGLKSVTNEELLSAKIDSRSHPASPGIGPNAQNMGGDSGKGNDVTFTKVRVTDRMARELADRFVKRRDELKQLNGKGFTDYNQLHNFVYALDSKQQLKVVNSDVEPAKRLTAKPDDSEQLLALQQAIVANILPNTRLTSVNPNFAMGVRYGDVSKANLGGGYLKSSSGTNQRVGWSTELTFFSNHYRIQSLGRVLGPTTRGTTSTGERIMGRRIRAEENVETTIKFFEAHRMSTQRGFVENYRPIAEKDKPLSEKISNLKKRKLRAFYPENLRSNPSPAAYDGYLQLPVSKTSDFLHGVDYKSGDNIAPLLEQQRKRVAKRIKEKMEEFTRTASRNANAMLSRQAIEVLEELVEARKGTSVSLRRKINKHRKDDGRISNRELRKINNELGGEQYLKEEDLAFINAPGSTEANIDPKKYADWTQKKAKETMAHSGLEETGQQAALNSVSPHLGFSDSGTPLKDPVTGDVTFLESETDGVSADVFQETESGLGGLRTGDSKNPNSAPGIGTSVEKGDNLEDMEANVEAANLDDAAAKEKLRAKMLDMSSEVKFNEKTGETYIHFESEEAKKLHEQGKITEKQMNQGYVKSKVPPGYSMENVVTRKRNGELVRIGKYVKTVEGENGKTKKKVKEVKLGEAERSPYKLEWGQLQTYEKVGVALNAAMTIKSTVDTINKFDSQSDLGKTGSVLKLISNTHSLMKTADVVAGTSLLSRDVGGGVNPTSDFGKVAGNVAMVAQIGATVIQGIQTYNNLSSALEEHSQVKIKGVKLSRIADQRGVIEYDSGLEPKPNKGEDAIEASNSVVGEDPSELFGDGVFAGSENPKERLCHKNGGMLLRYMFPGMVMGGPKTTDSPADKIASQAIKGAIKSALIGIATGVLFQSIMAGSLVAPGIGTVIGAVVGVVAVLVALLMADCDKDACCPSNQDVLDALSKYGIDKGNTSYGKMNAWIKPTFSAGEAPNNKPKEGARTLFDIGGYKKKNKNGKLLHQFPRFQAGFTKEDGKFKAFATDSRKTHVYNKGSTKRKEYKETVATASKTVNAKFSPARFFDPYFVGPDPQVPFERAVPKGHPYRNQENWFYPGRWHQISIQIRWTLDSITPHWGYSCKEIAPEMEVCDDCWLKSIDYHHDEKFRVLVDGEPGEWTETADGKSTVTMKPDGTIVEEKKNEDVLFETHESWDLNVGATEAGMVEFEPHGDGKDNNKVVRVGDDGVARDHKGERFQEVQKKPEDGINFQDQPGQPFSGDFVIGSLEFKNTKGERKDVKNFYDERFAYEGYIGPRKEDDYFQAGEFDYGGWVKNVYHTSYKPLRNKQQSMIGVGAQNVNPDKLPSRVDKGDRLQISVTMSTMKERGKKPWVGATPILDSVTVQVLRDEPEILHYNLSQ